MDDQKKDKKLTIIKSCPKTFTWIKQVRDLLKKLVTITFFKGKTNCAKAWKHVQQMSLILADAYLKHIK